MLKAAPATHEEVIARYAELRDQHTATAAALSAKRARALQIAVVIVLLLGWLALGGMRSTAQFAPLAAGFVALIALGWYALNQSGPITREERMFALYERAILRVDGTQPQSGRTGTEEGHDLRVPGHLYDYDLNLLGPDSLFGLLNTTRTGPGERGLARYLLLPATHDETCARQQAVQELLPQQDLRAAIALLGTTRFQQVSASFFEEWLDEPPPAFHPIFRIVLILTAIAGVGLLLAGVSHLASWGSILPNLALNLLVQGAICGFLRARVKPILDRGVRLQDPIKLIAQGLAVLQATEFTSPKLIALRKAALEPAGAVAALRKLESSLAIVEQRPKEYFLLLSLLLAAGTQAAISIAAWKRRYAESMRTWIEAWAEFEALNAIALHAFEHPEDAWPELLPATAAPHYQAVELRHPLLPGAIANDISLGQSNRFYLISGSNMAGKSTLLRSVGINAVLAYAGAPVRARSLSLTPLALGASLALTDSLAEGKSKFKAEVERLSKIVAASRTTPVLFLVDEIFSGTNSADRQTAAAAVLHNLLHHNAVGALSTHDLALTDLATADNAGTNVHMASPDPADPLAFDYKLKPGVNTSSNALAIIRMMGLETES